MRALVFGAGGFVGQHLVKHLVDHGDDVYMTVMPGDRLPLTNKHFSVDVTDSRAVREVFQTVKPEVVYHLAGIAFVPEAENDFDKALRVNVAGTGNVARQAHLLASDVSILYVSSAEVYGAVSADALPVTERTPIRPANNYSLSKYMGELVVERYARARTVSCSIARPFNHIGPGQNYRFVTANFALQLAKIAHGHATPVLRVGNLEARRDFCDVRDIVRAYRLLTASRGGVYNLGSGRAHSIQHILDTLISLSGVDVQVERDPERMRGPEIAELYTDCGHIFRECGWSPQISLEQSLADIYEYWFDQVAQGKD